MRLLLCALVLAACDDTRGASTESSNVCGPGPTSIELGQGLPFAPLDGAHLPIHRGSQGGFDIQISVRARGAMDPDHADVHFELSDGQGPVATYTDEDVLLETSAGGCDYDKAQMVFLSEDGDLLTEDQVTAFAGRPMTLDLSMSSAPGSAQTRQTVILDPPPPPTR